MEAEDARTIQLAATVGCAEIADWDAWRPMVDKNKKRTLEELADSNGEGLKLRKKLKSRRTFDSVVQRTLHFHSKGRTFNAVKNYVFCDFCKRSVKHAGGNKHCTYCKTYVENQEVVFCSAFCWECPYGCGPQ